MAVEKKKKPVYTVSSFATNIFEDFRYCARITDYPGGSTRDSKYHGILLYGYKDVQFLNTLREMVLLDLRKNKLDHLVFTSVRAPLNFPEFNRNNGREGYYMIDVGWFIKEGWIKSPNFLLVGRPY
jgi:hypothetical protein